jgi:hypothetical protein
VAEELDDHRALDPVRIRHELHFAQERVVALDVSAEVIRDDVLVNVVAAIDHRCRVVHQAAALRSNAEHRRMHHREVDQAGDGKRLRDRHTAGTTVGVKIGVKVAIECDLVAGDDRREWDRNTHLLNLPGLAHLIASS